jgi:hypothetical protein
MHVRPAAGLTGDTGTTSFSNDGAVSPQPAAAQVATADTAAGGPTPFARAVPPLTSSSSSSSSRSTRPVGAGKQGQAGSHSADSALLGAGPPADSSAAGQAEAPRAASMGGRESLSESQLGIGRGRLTPGEHPESTLISPRQSQAEEEW